MMHNEQRERSLLNQRSEQKAAHNQAHQHPMVIANNLKLSQSQANQHNGTTVNLALMKTSSPPATAEKKEDLTITPRSNAGIKFPLAKQITSDQFKPSKHHAEADRIKGEHQPMKMIQSNQSPLLNL